MSITRETVTQGDRLTRARLFVGLDQTEMANLLGRSRGTISNWERGIIDPPLSAVARWSKITGQSLDWIAFGDEKEESPSSSEGDSIGWSRLRESNSRPSHYECNYETVSDLLELWDSSPFTLTE